MPFVGVIHSEKSKLVRRVIATDAHWTLPDHVGEGEALYVFETSADVADNAHITQIHDKFYEEMGLTEETKPNPRCALVDANGMVTNMIMADPEIDKHPEGEVIAAPDDVAINDKWDGKKFLHRHATFNKHGVVTDIYWATEKAHGVRSERHPNAVVGQHIPEMEEVNVPTSGTKAI